MRAAFEPSFDVARAPLLSTALGNFDGAGKGRIGNDLLDGRAVFLVTKSLGHFRLGHDQLGLLKSPGNFYGHFLGKLFGDGFDLTFRHLLTVICAIKIPGIGGDVRLFVNH